MDLIPNVESAQKFYFVSLALRFSVMYLRRFGMLQ